MPCSSTELAAFLSRHPLEPLPRRPDYRHRPLTAHVASAGELRQNPLHAPRKFLNHPGKSSTRLTKLLQDFIKHYYLYPAPDLKRLQEAERYSVI